MVEKVTPTCPTPPTANALIYLPVSMSISIKIYSYWQKRVLTKVHHTCKHINWRKITIVAASWPEYLYVTYCKHLSKFEFINEKSLNVHFYSSLRIYNDQIMLFVLTVHFLPYDYSCFRTNIKFFLLCSIMRTSHWEFTIWLQYKNSCWY